MRTLLQVQTTQMRSGPAAALWLDERHSSAFIRRASASDRHACVRALGEKLGT